MTDPDPRHSFTRCWDEKCYQRASCARWTQRHDKDAHLHINTMRTPAEPLDKPCMAYI